MTAPETRLPADEFYEELLADISVSQEANRSLQSWLDTASDRLLATLRPHLLDIDAVVCGSFATGTHIRRSDWDVDIAVRVHCPPSEWDDPDRVLADLHRWLSRGLEADVSRTRETVTITEPESIGVRVIPCWRQGGRSWSLASSVMGLGRARPLDPVGHRDLMVARQHSLGGDAFQGLIRVVKHLNRAWRNDGSSALGSYDIDALALDSCREPVSLADALPQFLGGAAQASADCRAGTSARRQRALWSETENRLRQAADLTEEAVMTDDRQTAFELLAQVFGDVGNAPWIRRAEQSRAARRRDIA